MHEEARNGDSDCCEIEHETTAKTRARQCGLKRQRPALLKLSQRDAGSTSR